VLSDVHTVEILFFSADFITDEIFGQDTPEAA
jgi:hypothetical protein